MASFDYVPRLSGYAFIHTSKHRIMKTTQLRVTWRTHWDHVGISTFQKNRSYSLAWNTHTYTC